MEKFEITPMCAPPGSDDYCLCDEQHASRWYVSRGGQQSGWFDSRDMAEAYVSGELEAFIIKLNASRSSNLENDALYKLLVAGKATANDQRWAANWLRELHGLERLPELEDRADRFVWRDGDVEHHGAKRDV